jgi:Tol biopolymer transport system component
VYDPQRDALTRITLDRVLITSALWSPDGQHILIATAARGIMDVRADGAGQSHMLVPGTGLLDPTSFTADGSRLAYTESAAGKLQIRVVPIKQKDDHLEAGKPEPFLGSTFGNAAPAFSPDGRWLAYASDESGRDEVYVRPASGQGGKWQVSNNGGTLPRWPSNGHDLIYQEADRLMAATWSAKGDRFDAEKPRTWIAQIGGTQWDLSPDGKRVAVLTVTTPTVAPKKDHTIVFLRNFFDELRRKAPVTK